jgi:hypothetical protein
MVMPETLACDRYGSQSVADGSQGEQTEISRTRAIPFRQWARRLQARAPLVLCLMKFRAPAGSYDGDIRFDGKI